jgi:hypothetical protein
MKIKTKIIVILGVLLPVLVLANSVSPILEKMSLQQKGNFRSLLTIRENDFKVPTIIDIPLEFQADSKEQIMVTDKESNIVPAKIVTEVNKIPLTFTAKDSFGDFDAGKMVDGEDKTYFDLPFRETGGNYEVVNSNNNLVDTANGGVELRHSEERYSNNGQTGMADMNRVTIDLVASRRFVTDSVSFLLGKNVDKPVRIRLSSIENDKEKILLPETFFNSTMNFPRTNLKHLRIVLDYIKPLRISEIILPEKNPSGQVAKYARFIAQPKATYQVYYDTLNLVKMPNLEMPNLERKGLRLNKEVSFIDNPLYKKADSDQDGVLDNVDNCPQIANKDQKDIDNNKIGDACEDFDHDGIINAVDNCPDVPNKLQEDQDVDGLGDKCDGEESRFMEKYPWIPYVTLGIVLVIIVSLLFLTLKVDSRERLE